MKYRPEFPDHFGCIQDSRAFCQQFFKWYNEEHRALHDLGEGWPGACVLTLFWPGRFEFG